MAVTGTYHHVHLISHDPDAAADWYVRALGGQVQKRAEVKGARNVQLKVGESNFYIRGVRPGESVVSLSGRTALGVHHLGLWVDDIEASIRQYVQAGGELVEPVSTGTTGNIVAFVRGPDGVLIEFLQPPKR
ncbi:MAG: VOC family protein [Candidatus Tectomicrobia bacterium]|nr:VOC family protein [Candidatus Tectomicrobia bacterium]